MSAEPRHRVLLDAETLVTRTHAAAMISDGLRSEPAWRDDGEAGRRQVARRIAYVKHLVKMGRIGG